VIGVDLRDAEVTADLSAPAGRAAAAASLASACPGYLDGLVCCAGVGPNARPAELTVSINYFGVIELLDSMRTRPRRRRAASASPPSTPAVVSMSMQASVTLWP
jgi:NAD(P)-dependent dehydrogenase (short-subunit alcohol dehydrogenase family)